MAFWHLKGNTTSTTTYQHRFLNTIKGIWDGSITSTSGLDSLAFNQAASSVSGTHPTAGLYTWNTTTTAASTSNQDSNVFYGIKKHYATGGTGVDSAYSPSCRVYFNGDTSYGLSFNIANSSGGNPGLPTGGNQLPSGYTSTTAAAGRWPYFTSPGSANFGWNDTFIIHNDTTFAINITNSSGANYFFMVSDFEYMKGADDYLASANPTYCPHGLFTAGMYAKMNVDNQGMYNINTSTPLNYGFIAAYTPNYLAVDGSMRTPTKHKTQTYYVSSSTSTVMTLNPEPGTSIHDIPASGGGSVKPMIPVRMLNTVERGYSNYTSYAMPHPKLMPNVYRTDDNGYANGDVILDGSTKYRVFRVHKCGDHTGITDSKSVHTACYAFPEDTVTYG